MKKTKDKSLVDKIKEKEIQIIELKNKDNKKVSKKLFDTAMAKLSTDIYIEFGLNEDEADALGVALYTNKFINGELK